jgi:hypothetical protein
VLLPEAISSASLAFDSLLLVAKEPPEPVRVRGADPRNDWEHYCGDCGDENDFVRCHDY